MAFCMRCGHALRSADKFCTGCGAPVPEVPERTVSAHAASTHAAPAEPVTPSPAAVTPASGPAAVVARETQPAVAPSDKGVVPTPRRGDTLVFKRQWGVRLLHDGQVAVLSLEEARAMIGVAQVIYHEAQRGPVKAWVKQAKHHGAVRPELLDGLFRFSARLHVVLPEKGQAAIDLHVDDAERKAVTELVRQTRLRSTMDFCIRHICTRCKHSTLTDPQYERLKKRNKNIMNAARGFGVAVSATSGVVPFFMASSLLGFMKLDPDYVCPNCKSMKAEETMTVFCPCGSQRDEAWLTLCPQCGRDFAAGVDLSGLWQGRAAAGVAEPSQG